ncbi:MAG: hypothetical protein AB1403_11315, partial [Candidatus Riflebacteria bacterium]
RVKGTDLKFSVGQEVAVIQIGSEYGFSEIGMKSQLIVPDSVLPGLIKDAPASCAMAVIASIAKNRRSYYSASLIQAVEGNSVTVNGMILQSEVSGMKAGDGCLIDVVSKPAKVLGWWQTVPAGSGVGVPVIFIERVPYSSSVDMRLVRQLPDGTYITDKSVRLRKFELTEYVDAAWIVTCKTDDSKEYFYSWVHMFRNFGAAYEDHYVRWNKENFTVEELAGGYNEWILMTQEQPGYNKTADDLYFWRIDSKALISETVDGEKTEIFEAGYTLYEGEIFPVKGYTYGHLLPEAEP